MFDFVQERKRLVQFVLLLIILPFAFWGVDSYRKSTGGDALATVNGDKIGAQEFDNALRQQQQRMREAAGPAFDQSIFDKPEVKRSILDGLVTQHLLASESREIGLTVTDEQVAALIATVGAFQKDGKFDKPQYEAALSGQGLTPSAFEAMIRQELSTRELTDAYTQNGYTSKAVVDNLIRLNEQQRVVSLAKFDLDHYLQQAKVDDAAVNDYYQKNQSAFQTPERARVEYVVFSAEALQARMTVDDAEIKKYYQEHQAEFASQEQRQASHILINIPPNATDDQIKAMQEKATQVLQKVRQNPANFAALAKEYSQDPGSAANGGDLGMFARGAMVKPFEDAVFKLKVGEVSELVRSDFGFHIIRLTAIKPGKMQTLAEVKGMIAARLKEQMGGDKFAELADKFSNAVYEQSDTLKPAADLVKMPIQQAGWLNKGSIPGGVWTAKAMEAVFSEDALKNKRNTKALEVAPDTLMAARVVEFQPASVRPLAEVSASIRNKLQHQQALDLLAKQGAEWLQQLQHGEKTSLQWLPAQTMTRASHGELDVAFTRKLFQADASKLPGYVGMADAQGGYLLARIDSVKDGGAIDDAKRNQYLQRVRQITGEELLQAYLGNAKAHAKITMKQFTGDDKQ